MRIVTTVLDLAGAALIVAGLCVLSVPLGVIVGGLLCLAASREMTRSRR